MSKENAEENLNIIWEKIKKESLPEEPLPGEKTINQFMEETGITRRQARYYLNKEVDAGRLTKRVIKNENYYYPVL